MITIHLNIYGMGGDNTQKKKEEAAQRILKNADLYKVCEGCESVVLFESVYCPVCDGYRFNENLTVLVQTIKALLKKKNTSIVKHDDLDWL